MLVVMIMSVAGVLMSFLMMFIERFFALLNTSPLVPWYRQPSTYGYTLVICYFIIVSPWIASAYLFPAFLTVEENAAFVKQYIRGGEALFMGNQEFLVIRKDYFFIFIHATIVMAFIFGLFLLVFFSLYLNQYRKARRFLSPKAREIHSMLFRSMLFQLIALGSLVFSSFCLDILVFAFNLPDYYLLAPFMLAWSFPVIDNIVVIFTIRPYREFVLGLFCKKKIEPQPTSAPGTQMEMASPQTPN
uniref:Serpentine receptor class gamma n=1 Tax=Panagrolaimus sp. JU765 TaxID=591449 RepID=A0AC34RJD4_9BILA